MLKDIALKSTYDTYRSNPVTEFLVPCLEQAKTYDRAVAYFSAALIACIPEVFSDFSERGGKYRLICSPNLTGKDANFLLGFDSDAALASLNKSIDDVDSPSELGPALDLFSKMLSVGSMELKFAIPKDNFGALFHQKIGTIGDGENYVGFSGSNNESLSAWWPDHNSERFHVFPSWVQGKDDLAQETRDDFEDMWANNYPGFEIVDYRDALAFVQRRENETRSLKDIKTQVKDWYRKKRAGEGNRSSKVQLRDYQIEVLENWKKNGYQGIVSFATGAGKTITALKGISNWFDLHPKGSVIILVPSKRLQLQWGQEIAKFGAFDQNPVLLVGGEGSKSLWANAISAFTQQQSDNVPKIVIALMQSAATPIFWNRVKSNPDLLLLADEMHNLGTEARIELLETIKPGGILGLSATPKRFDDEENQKLTSIFGRELDPVIGISEAQKMGVLVNYTYHPFGVKLLEEEEDLYRAISSEIATLMAQKKSNPKGFNREKQLQEARLRRAEVVKNAANKPGVLVDILRDSIAGTFSWLIFCNNTDQLRNVKDLIPELAPMEFHQKMDGDQPETLYEFANNGGVLLAIDMMNEGVDIPSIQNAILGASSQNPREFIQRLGRVLRKDPMRAKQPKVIDLIVLNQEGFAINKSELVRARLIAKTALNSSVELKISGWDNFDQGEDSNDARSS